MPIYYDFEAQQDAQDSKFVALAADDVDADRHFPLSSFFDPVVFSSRQRALGDDDERLREIVTVQSRFSGTLIPVESFEEEDRASVAIVFERVNRLGIKLDTFQLLTAWTWSEDFDLQDKFEELAERFEYFGFSEVGTDNDLMLKCAAAVLRNDPAPTALIDVNGGEVRGGFDRVVRALERAIDFLRSLHVYHLRLLPYSALLVPLCAYFSEDQGRSTPALDREVLLRWFWRTSFTHRYSGNPSRNVKSDVQEARKLRLGEPSLLDDISDSIDANFYLTRNFNQGTVATKSFLLQLAAHNPLSFTSGNPVALTTVLAEPNRREYHHCYPRAYLAKTRSAKLAEVDDGSSSIPADAIANFAFLSRAENREISDRAPSDYRSTMPADVAKILESQLLPATLFDDKWDVFALDRAILLAKDANRLMATSLLNGYLAPGDTTPTSHDPVPDKS